MLGHLELGSTDHFEGTEPVQFWVRPEPGGPLIIIAVQSDALLDRYFVSEALYVIMHMCNALHIRKVLCNDYEAADAVVGLPTQVR